MNSYWFPVNRTISPPTLSVTAASMGITTAGFAPNQKASAPVVGFVAGATALTVIGYMLLV